MPRICSSKADAHRKKSQKRWESPGRRSPDGSEKGNGKSCVSPTISTEQIIAGMIKQISDIQDGANARPEGQRALTAKEADTIVKLSSAIKKLQNEAGITDIVNVGIKFTNWLRSIDIEKAKEYNELWDLFIKDQLK